MWILPQFLKMGKGYMNRYFLKKDTEMAKHTKRCSTSLVTREMQTESIMAAILLLRAIINPSSKLRLIIWAFPRQGTIAGGQKPENAM